TPTVEALDQHEVELFCTEAGYEARLVETGFVPKSDDERLMLAPPTANRDVSNWQTEDQSLDSVQPSSPSDGLDDVRRRLEGLL
ncbi:DUF3110 domain-containing protein, partial [Synechococcus sp. AH-229-G18]|nr:DUF3110 domain-containing protein [Synechococcus sp. AH-229-G18]